MQLQCSCTPQLKAALKIQPRLYINPVHPFQTLTAAISRICTLDDFGST